MEFYNSTFRVTHHPSETRIILGAISRGPVLRCDPPAWPQGWRGMWSCYSPLGVLRWSKTLPETLVWKRAMKTITMTPSNYQLFVFVWGSRILRYPLLLHDIPGQIVCVDQFPPVLSTQMVMKSGKVRESLPKIPLSLLNSVVFFWEILVVCPG